MTTILEHVVVICLGMLLPRRSYMQDIFGLPYSTTALMSFRSAMPARPTITKFGQILLLFILWSQLVLLQNGALIS
jgi:hypothetical protein